MNTAYEIRGPALPCNCCHCAKFTYSPVMVHISGVGSAYTYLCKACTLAMSNALCEAVEKVGDSPAEAQEGKRDTVDEMDGLQPHKGWEAGKITLEDIEETLDSWVHTKGHRR